MQRRTFLQKSTLLLSGASLAGLGGLFPRRVWAGGVRSDDFSIDVVTDQPGHTIRHIERLIQHSSLRRHTVRFAEFQLPGSHVGDIVLVRSQQLIDFRTATDDLSRQLTQTARALSLPRRHEHPMLLRFYSENETSTPETVNIFCGNILVAQLPIGEDREAHRIEGAKGHVDISVQDRSVRMVAASCKHKTCMELGAVSQPGQTLVCIPSQISIAIEGRSRSDVDSVTF